MTQDLPDLLSIADQTGLDVLSKHPVYALKSPIGWTDLCSAIHLELMRQRGFCARFEEVAHWRFEITEKGWATLREST